MNHVNEIGVEFRGKFVLVSAKLSDQKKVDIFVEGARFCQCEPDFLANIVESILTKHEIDGKGVVVCYAEYEHNNMFANREIVLSILAYYTQHQARALRGLLFPNTEIRAQMRHYGVEFTFDWKKQTGSIN